MPGSVRRSVTRPSNGARRVANDSVAVLVHLMAAGLLAAIAVLTTLTGARTPVVWFKACPLVLATVIELLLVGSAL